MIWISLSLAAVGLVMVVVGWPRLLRRREGDAATCAACEYDLTGLAGEEAEAKVCPECGSELGKAGAVVKGRRTRRGKVAKVAVRLGAIMFLTGASLGGSQAWRWSQSYDWNKAKPVWLLHRQARASTATSGVGVLEELVIRLEAGKLSDDNVQSIIETVLARQADMQTPWNMQWGSFMIAAIEHDLVALAQREQYIGGVVVLETAVRPWVYPGEPVPGSFFVSELRCGSKERYGAYIRFETAQIGEKTLDYRLYGAGMSIGLAGWGWGEHELWILGGSHASGTNVHRRLRDPDERQFSSSVRAPDALGKTQMSMTWRIAVTQEGRGVSGNMRSQPIEINELTVEIDQTHTHDIEIVEPGTHAITTRPGNDGLVATAEDTYLERHGDERVVAYGTIVFGTLDATAGYDLVWILPEDIAKAWQVDREWIVANPIYTAFDGSFETSLQYQSDRFKLPKAMLDAGALEGVQIVLRPSARISRMTVDVMEIPADSTDLGTHRVPIND